MTNCRVNDPVFERGLRDFIATCNVVKTFRAARILQIGPRPYEFYSTMCNEGELIEKFNIECVPVPLPELTRTVKQVMDECTGDGSSDLEAQLTWIAEHFVRDCTIEQTKTIGAMAVAIRRMLRKYHCTAGCIQCWNELQHELGIMPCATNSILNEEGTPITCETDVHGAITALMVEAADMGRKRSFFVDWTIHHPNEPNGELLQHCGPWPCSVACEKPKITLPLAFDHNGALTAEAKHGHLTLARLDGDGRAIAQDAKIYLMDEPLQGVDIKTEGIIMSVIKEFQSIGKTVIVVHHDLSTVEKYFDHIILLNKILIAQGKVSDAFNKETISKAYSFDGSVKDELINI